MTDDSAMETLVASERWIRITDLIEEKGRATVEEIVRVLNVSPATARRDLRKMHRLGLISRTRGGAVRPTQAAYDRGFVKSQHVSMPEKERIGLLAASLIEPGDTVIIDGGSTNYQVAMHIDVANAVVVTNAHAVVSALMPKKNVEVVMIGGLLSQHSGVAVGPDAIKMIQQLRADKAIMGVNGISVVDGITIPNRLVAETKQAIVEHCLELIVVADSSKLGASSLFSIAPITEVDKLITDSNATEEQIREFQDAGVEVLVAPNGRRATEPAD